MAAPAEGDRNASYVGRTLRSQADPNGAVVGLFAGRLASMIGSGINPLTSPFDILIVRGGVATGLAALAALATVAAMARGEVLLDKRTEDTNMDEILDVL